MVAISALLVLGTAAYTSLQAGAASEHREFGIIISGLHRNAPLCASGVALEDIAAFATTLPT